MGKFTGPGGKWPVVFLALLFCVLFAGSASAAPVVQIATFAGGQLTIKGSGLSGTTVTVSFNGKSLPIVSKTTTKIVATLTPAPVPGSYRTVVKVDTASTAAYVSISPAVISGEVQGTGTAFIGTGYTSLRNSTGNYTLNFPAGTFNGSTYPVLVVTPLSDGVTASGTNSISFSGDGSASINVTFTNDTNFFFIVAQSR